MTIIWCTVPEIWTATDRIFCHFGPFFAVLHLPPNKPQNQNFEKLRKIPGDIIVLYMCTTSEGHKINGS